MTPALLSEYAAVMRANRILRVSAEGDEDGEDFSIELSPTAWDSMPIPSASDVPADLGAGEKKCPCGHLQDSEHNNDGLCIAGACPYTVCHPDATQIGRAHV